MTTWVKVYNSLPSHPKMLAAAAGTPCSPGWLFVCGCCYSNEHLTDGFIPAYSLTVVAPGTTRVEAAAARLVAAGMWHEVEGGWRIHDYGEVQRSADEIRERRSRDAQRKASVRRLSERSPRGQSADSHPDISRSPTNVRDLDVEGREQRAEVDTSSSGDEVADMENPDDVKNCRLLADLAKERNPKFKVKSRSRWMNDMRLLRERDGNGAEEIERAIRWVFADDFWGGVIESPGGLREHFPKIWDRMHHAAVVPIGGQKESAGALLRAINGGVA